VPLDREEKSIENGDVAGHQRVVFDGIAIHRHPPSVTAP
jgi:hypothetical protein